MMENLDYEVVRDDKFYELTIPKYEQTGDSVFYEVHLKDLVANRDYIRSFRFKEFKEFYENLKKLEVLFILVLALIARVPQNTHLEKDKQESQNDSGKKINFGELFQHFGQWPIRPRSTSNKEIYSSL